MNNKDAGSDLHRFNVAHADRLNDKQIISKLRQEISELEGELYNKNSTAGSRVYKGLVEAALGNGIEMLTEVAYEMADRIADLEVQRDEAVSRPWEVAWWRPIVEAPELVPLLVYYCPFPEADEVEQRPEYWDVAVRRGGRWHNYFPMWEGGCGTPLDGEPDFFHRLDRPAGKPKWRIGEDGELHMQLGGE